VSQTPKHPGQIYQGFVPGRHEIDSYGNGGFRFADMSHRGSILALPSGVHVWEAVTAKDFSIAAFGKVMAEAEAIDTLLIGTGPDIVFLDESLRAWLKTGGMAVDAMSTGSAARIYNIMVGEGRRVAAALLAV
jgi:uncharacterized protein